MLAFANIEKISLVLCIIVAASGLLALVFLTVKLVMGRAAKKSRADVQNADSLAAQGKLDKRRLYVKTDADGNLMLNKGETYLTGAYNQLDEGKYVLLSKDRQGKFNVRICGLVREYASGDVITLSSGDSVCPVSDDILLGKIED